MVKRSEVPCSSSSLGGLARALTPLHIHTWTTRS